MKHVAAFLTIGSCLLLSSAGVAFAANPHGGPAKGAGQLGTGGTGAASCGATTAAGAIEASPPGQVGNLNTNSPFTTSKEYAGAGAGNSAVNSPHANSQYDNACFQHMP